MFPEERLGTKMGRQVDHVQHGLVADEHSVDLDGMIEP